MRRPFFRSSSARLPSWPLTGLLLLVACQTPLPPASPGAAPNAQPDAVPGEAIVRFVPGLSEARKLDVRQGHGVEDVLVIGPDLERWRLKAGDGGQGELAGLEQEPALRFAQPNYRYRIAPLAPSAAAPWPRLLALEDSPFDPNEDPGRYRQWYLDHARFPEAWKRSRGEGVTVAVIDSGVDPHHPDLAANLLPLIDEITAQGGHDIWNGENFDGRDGHGHGTHVCGLIGAVAHNGRGISGAAPAVKILPIKAVSTTGETTDVMIARAIADAIAHGVHVVNLSLGGAKPSQVLLEALNEAQGHGVALVIAAGNDNSVLNFPAAYDGAISVGALTETDVVASYSNHGDRLVLVAPGGGRPDLGEGQPLYSTLPTYPSLLTRTNRMALDYGSLSGTSMATPLVSAAVALLLAQEPLLTPVQLRTRLAASCEDLGAPGRDPYYGYGALDAARALAQGGQF